MNIHTTICQGVVPLIQKYQDPGLVRVKWIVCRPLGSLTISSVPEGARILIYNKDTGEKTPHTLSNLNTDSIIAGIDDGNNSRTIETVIGAGTNQKYSFDFTNA